jgi:hypothetical protein
LANLADDNEETRVSVHGSTGNLVPTANQLADYQRRGVELDDVCVWDFISQVDKVSKTSDKQKHSEKGDDADADEFQDGFGMPETMLDDVAKEFEPGRKKPLWKLTVTSVPELLCKKVMGKEKPIS